MENTAASNSRPRLAGLKVLVIDDSKTIRRTDALLRQLYSGFVVLLAAAFARFVLAPVRARGFFLSRPTLVSMKVKLTD